MSDCPLGLLCRANHPTPRCLDCLYFSNTLGGDALSIKRTIVLLYCEEGDSAIDFQEILDWPEWEEIPGGVKQRELIRICLENWKANLKGRKIQAQLLYNISELAPFHPTSSSHTVSEGVTA